jgi:uncharacterized membrane protein YccC
MMVLSIDITPWAVITVVVGTLFGAWVRKQVYNVFAVLATFFGAYAITPILEMQYNIFVTISWLLATFFGASSLANLVATWVRRIEMMLQTLQTQLETLRLAIEEK